MIVYLDTSLVIGRLMGETPPHSSVPWGKWEAAFSSRLLQVEGFRTLDRLRLSGTIRDKDMPPLVQTLQLIMGYLGEIPVSEAVLHRASLPFSTIVRTLDAIHIASALLYREREKKEITFLTHDVRQGLAARAAGLRAEGF